MRAKKLSLAVWLAMAALGSMGVAGTANAAVLQIQLGPDAAREVIGDAGGSIYPWPANTVGVGPGVPSADAGWPNNGAGGYPAGFAPDPSFGNAYGTSGWDASSLWLSESATLRFQFMGGGDSSQNNEFWVYNGAAWQQLFVDHTTPPVSAAGNLVPVINGTVGTNEFLIPVTVGPNGGYVPFYFKADVPGGAQTIVNRPEDDPTIGILNPGDDTQWPGYMLGADPYLAPGQYSCSNEDGNPYSGTCGVVYAALSDHQRGPGEHDYSDLGVRISVVPEPGSMLLMGTGLLGLAGLRRRKA